TNVSYLLIDAALRLNQAIYGDRTRDVVTRLWDRVQEQLETQQAHLIGWYHTHPPLPLSLTEHDLETHEHYFGEPWQVTLLPGPAPPASRRCRPAPPAPPPPPGGPTIETSPRSSPRPSARRRPRPPPPRRPRRPRGDSRLRRVRRSGPSQNRRSNPNQSPSRR